MEKITTIGLDLAKHVFHVVGCDRHGKVLRRKMLRRGQVRAYFANVPRCVVGMEACAGSHFWARELRALGHEVRLIPAQHVKAYVRGNKNDYNDARAIGEAAGRSDIRAVAVKTVEQQDVQALYRLRAARVKERTTLCAPTTTCCSPPRASCWQVSMPRVPSTPTSDASRPSPAWRCSSSMTSV